VAASCAGKAYAIYSRATEDALVIVHVVRDAGPPAGPAQAADEASAAAGGSVRPRPMA